MPAAPTLLLTPAVSKSLLIDIIGRFDDWHIQARYTNLRKPASQVTEEYAATSPTAAADFLYELPGFNQLTMHVLLDADAPREEGTPLVFDAEPSYSFTMEDWERALNEFAHEHPQAILKAADMMAAGLLTPPANPELHTPIWHVVTNLSGYWQGELLETLNNTIMVCDLEGHGCNPEDFLDGASNAPEDEA